MRRATTASMLSVRAALSSRQPRREWRATGGVDVRVEVGIVRVDEPALHNRVVEALAGGDHAAV
jgi:hypothetical protein